MNEELKEIYVSAPSDPDKIIVHCLELYHSSFSAPVRITNQKQDFTATLEATAPNNPSQAVVFTATDFKLTLPKVEENPTQTIDIRISNIDQLAARYLDTAIENPSPVTVIYRVYIMGDTSAPAINPPATLALGSAQADLRMLVAKAKSIDVINKQFPTSNYNGEDFPGLIR